MPVDSSPTASPPHSASAEDLSDNKDLKRNGMRITFKARQIAARSSDHLDGFAVPFCTHTCTSIRRMTNAA